MTQPASAAADRKRVGGFDGLRAISALLVFFEHRVRDMGTGAIGVWIFFCLSGYLIVGILNRSRRKLEAAPNTLGPGRALLDFWKNRALRILPIYYLVTALVFGLTTLESSRALPYYALYVQNFYIAFVTHAWSGITHFWSLAVEQQFYVLWAPLLILVSARAHARLLAVVLTACVGVTLYGEARGWDGMAMSLLPPANFAFMALGGLAVLAAPGSLAQRFFGSTALLVVSVLAFGASFAVTRSAYDALGGTPLVVYVTALFFSATLVGWTAQHQSSGVVRLLEIPLLRWLGTISYGFYVYHPLLPGRERIALWLGADWLHRVPWSLWILLELAASLVVSHVSWKYFERRFLALKKSAAKPVAAPVTE